METQWFNSCYPHSAPAAQDPLSVPAAAVKDDHTTPSSRGVTHVRNKGRLRRGIVTVARVLSRGSFGFQCTHLQSYSSSIGWCTAIRRI